MQRLNSRHYNLIVILITLLIATAFMMLWSGIPGNGVAGDNPYKNMGGDFTLQSKKGEVSLSDYQGKVVVLYFGYTSCPDVCPTSMGLLSLALNKLTPDEAAQLQALFISVDPARDSLDMLANYTQAFNPMIRGITGSDEVIAEIAKRYGVAYMKVNTPGSAMGYTVDHSSRYYVIDRDGQLVRLIDHGSSPEHIVATLREALKL